MENKENADKSIEEYNEYHGIGTADRKEYIAEGGTMITPAAHEPTLSIDGLIAHVRLVQEVHKAVMQEGEHYGKIPGTTKNTLFKSGAEKLSLTFKLSPSYEVKRDDLEGGHREYEIICLLTHRPTGEFIASGVGLCSSMESKYRYRTAALACPSCGQDTIIKGKEEYGGGWLCFAKKGGCGAKYKDNDPVITEQPRGQVENEDIADIFNTILKMAKKRAHVDAILTATAASDIFTQDIGDDETPDKTERPHKPAPEKKQTEVEQKTGEKLLTLTYKQRIKNLEGYLKTVLEVEWRNEPEGDRRINRTIEQIGQWESEPQKKKGLALVEELTKEYYDKRYEPLRAELSKIATSAKNQDDFYESVNIVSASLDGWPGFAYEKGMHIIHDFCKISEWTDEQREEDKKPIDPDNPLDV